MPLAILQASRLPVGAIAPTDLGCASQPLRNMSLSFVSISLGTLGRFILSRRRLFNLDFNRTVLLLAQMCGLQETRKFIKKSIVYLIRLDNAKMRHSEERQSVLHFTALVETLSCKSLI